MKETYRILAEDKKISNNTWKTGLNNNDLIVGISGAGKTRSYVKPNILQCNESMIVVDTKNTLYEETKNRLKNAGYKVWLLDLTDMENSPMGYNPLSAVRYDAMEDEYNDQDIAMIAAAFCPIESQKDLFWDYATRLQLEALIAFVLEALPREEQNMLSVARLQNIMHMDYFDQLFLELAQTKDDSLAVRKWKLFVNTKNADRTNDCIRLMLGERLHPFISRGAERLADNWKQVDFEQLGKRKTALFINVSDTDRAQDKLVNIIYTQALQKLIQYADKCRGRRLPVPVRFMLDDFAANAVIPDFDKIISVIRSREIYVSLIIQSLSQLYAMYGEDKAKTIINNCDNLLYLGGQDVDTANYIGVKANKTANTILNMPAGEAILFTRGEAPCNVKKYDPRHYEAGRRRKDVSNKSGTKNSVRRSRENGRCRDGGNLFKGGASADDAELL